MTPVEPQKLFTGEFNVMDSFDSLSSSRGSQILTGKGYMNTILERKLIEKSHYSPVKKKSLHVRMRIG
jgi:hypothetical protein